MAALGWDLGIVSGVGLELVFAGFGAVAGLCRRFSQKNAIFEPVGDRVQGLSPVWRVF